MDRSNLETVLGGRNDQKNKTERVTSEAVPGPVAGTKITEAYARMVARDAYFWAWPMINIYNKRLAYKQVPEPGLMGGILPVAPVNRVSMLTDYIEPEERFVACPNQDVVCGLWCRRPWARHQSRGDPGAELRQAFLGVPGG